MNDYILFMHNDADADAAEISSAAWEKYFAMLKESGRFQGGSSIGQGVCMTKAGEVRPITSHLAGYIQVQAENLEAAKTFVNGNPVFEAGGIVEIRELTLD